jgi:hypothetical protein
VPKRSKIISFRDETFDFQILNWRRVDGLEVAENSRGIGFPPMRGVN